MLCSISLDPGQPERAVTSLLESWKRDDLKVFVLEATSAVESILEFYNGLLPSIGTAAYIAEDVAVGDRHQQRTGEIWMDVKYDPRIKNAYRHSNSAQPLHTDGSYIAQYPNASLMACETNAPSGGETTFLDGDVLLQVLRDEAPALLKKVLAVTIPHARSGDRRELPIVRLEQDKIFLNWNYYCVDSKGAGETAEIRQAFHEFLMSSPGVRAATLGVKLDRGDAVVWKDERVLHGRNGFVAHQVADRFLWKCAVDVGAWH
jgi:alpha-ketoglutarate-dependent taurine dioxygenase